MYKKMTYVVALGCICASAASTVNYDLLGRKGSKMNTPMVYKNVDYTKVKKNEQQQVGSALETRALAKRSSGLSSNIDALEGAYNNRNYGTSNSAHYYMKRYFTNGNVQTNTYNALNGYMNLSNQVFIPVAQASNYNPNYTYTTERTRAYETHYNINESYYPFTNENTYVGSHYGYPGDMIMYYTFNEMENATSDRRAVPWFDASSYNGTGYDDVGIHMTVGALPVMLDYGEQLKYVRLSNTDQFDPTPIKEMASSRMFSTIRASAKRPVIYVGKKSPTNPRSRNPKIYIGVHDGVDEPGIDDSMMVYSSVARELDNYIYDNRTIEIAAAGNYAVRFNNAHVSAKGQAANAITVGAADIYSATIAGYTSYRSKYCRKGVGKCTDGKNIYDGSRKPEIYNYAHFYLNDVERTYTNWDNGGVNNYPPLYDGTEIAAAHTASMVKDLLIANPFYRWHPEVVKALLMSSGFNHLNDMPYPHTPATTEVPTYYSLIFDNDHNNYFHESRYWMGSMEKLKTHVVSTKNEIRFTIKRPTDKNYFTAAIAWLTSGDDIDSIGVIPQDFDLYVYENNANNTEIANLNKTIAKSTDGRNAFEVVKFRAESEYITFRIFLWSDNPKSENNGQVVLGFDVASYR